MINLQIVADLHSREVQRSVGMPCNFTLLQYSAGTADHLAVSKTVHTCVHLGRLVHGRSRFIQAAVLTWRSRGRTCS
jgi:hypothetical protein